MDLFGHDHPGSELIKMPSALAIPESIGHYTRYSSILQPNRSESSSVHFTVQDEGGAARRYRRACGRLRQPGPGDGASQTPGDKQEARLREIGMPVGKPSAVEHDELAGESACPTYSAWTGGKSQENVETPGAGNPACSRIQAALSSYAR